MNLKKELPLIIIVLLPFIYLAYIWTDLPDVVPVHWNGAGEIDGYGNKKQLIMIPFFLPVLVYVLMLATPYLDTKNQIKNMGDKFNRIKWSLTTIMSVLAIYIIHSSKTAEFANPNVVFILIGILFSVLGNYFKTIKPNYFLGIRTPWTLENEEVWKKTHEMGGKYWFVGGIIIVFTSLALPMKINLFVFLGITLVLVLIPTVYSYRLYKKVEK